MQLTIAVTGHLEGEERQSIDDCAHVHVYIMDKVMYLASAGEIHCKVLPVRK